MVKITIIVLACLACSTIGYPKKRLQFNMNLSTVNQESVGCCAPKYDEGQCLMESGFPFVSREVWGARDAKSVSPLEMPVPFVVIHHTYIPTVCESRMQCMVDMRSMQRVHMDTNGWEDIGYNFAVGGEGSVYEGRGWEAVGAHAVGYNVRSIGIVLIGDFVSKLPDARQQQTAKDLIKAGVRLGYISPDYKLITHRQVSATECPGEALYNEVTTWDHFTLL